MALLLLTESHRPPRTADETEWAQIAAAHRQALDLVSNDAERRFLQDRLGGVPTT